VYLYEGTLWEAVLAAVGATAANIAQEEVYDFIEKSVVGGDNLTVELDKDAFAADKTVSKTIQGVTTTINSHS